MDTKTLIVALCLSWVCAAQAPTHSVTLTITDPNNPTGTTYNYYREVGTCPTVPPTSTAGFTLLNPAPVAALTFTDSTVTVGASYCYVATAVIGTAESLPSPDAGGRILPFSPVSLMIAAK